MQDEHATCLSHALACCAVHVPHSSSGWRPQQLLPSTLRVPLPLSLLLLQKEIAAFLQQQAGGEDAEQKPQEAS